MSNTDSFIEEVTEEVKRDRLFKLIKKWWWAAALLVLLLVGGAAFNEWRKAQERQVAQDFGDALLSSLDGAAGGAEITFETPGQAAIGGHFEAARALTEGQVALMSHARNRSFSSSPTSLSRWRQLSVKEVERRSPTR